MANRLSTHEEEKPVGNCLDCLCKETAPHAKERERFLLYCLFFLLIC